MKRFGIDAGMIVTIAGGVLLAVFLLGLLRGRKRAG